jgi:hypothetical protein
VHGPFVEGTLGARAAARLPRCVLAVVALLVTLYVRTDIPEPNAEATAAAVRILYEDGGEIGPGR